MRLQRNLYEVMGLQRNATPSEVKQKYYDLARQFHPDRAADKVLAERIFVQINLAYRTLKDPDKRSLYDAGLDREATRASPASPSATSSASQSASQPSGTSSQPAQRTMSPQHAADLIKRAGLALMSGDRITSHKLCIEVTRADPSNVQAHVLLGDIYAEQGRRQEALHEYAIALDLAPELRLLQEKIKRLEGGPATPSWSAQPRPTAPAPKPEEEAERRGSLFDRIIGRR